MLPPGPFPCLCATFLPKQCNTVLESFINAPVMQCTVSLKWHASPDSWQPHAVLSHFVHVHFSTESKFSQGAGKFHSEWSQPGAMTMGPATSRIFSSPYSSLTSASANSNAVPGPLQP